jgi:hypothetical protein
MPIFTALLMSLFGSGNLPVRPGSQPAQPTNFNLSPNFKATALAFNDALDAYCSDEGYMENNDNYMENNNNYMQHDNNLNYKGKSSSAFMAPMVTHDPDVTNANSYDDNVNANSNRGHHGNMNSAKRNSNHGNSDAGKTTNSLCHLRLSGEEGAEIIRSIEKAGRKAEEVLGSLVGKDGTFSEDFLAELFDTLDNFEKNNGGDEKPEGDISESLS